MSKNEPFGRQLKPVTVTISGGDLEDREYWHSRLRSLCEHQPCVTQNVKGGTSFNIHPDTNND